MAVEGRGVSHYYILVICQFIDFMSFFAEFGICNMHIADKNRRSLVVVFC